MYHSYDHLSVHSFYVPMRESSVITAELKGLLIILYIFVANITTTILYIPAFPSS